MALRQSGFSESSLLLGNVGFFQLLVIRGLWKHSTLPWGSA